MSRLRSALDAFARPYPVTEKGTTVAEGLAEQMGLASRVDIFEAEQFLAGNLFEIGGFGSEGRKETARGLVEAYNRIIDECETDPSLRIRLGD